VNDAPAVGRDEACLIVAARAVGSKITVAKASGDRPGYDEVAGLCVPIKLAKINGNVADARPKTRRRGRAGRAGALFQ